MQDLSYEITVPDLDDELEQHEECVIVDFGNRREKVRLQDYAAIYRAPGLYEQIFYRRLKYNSPKAICDMLEDELAKWGCSLRDRTVLDFGAGNGLVGEQLKKRGCASVVGVDILVEAKDAAYRDRPGVYTDYYVMDLSQFDVKELGKLKEYGFDTLVTVSALGFGDIPPAAFRNAFDLIEDEGWVVFNIRDRFLTDEDDSGYRDTLDGIVERGFVVCQRTRYCHRLSLRGESIDYIAILGRRTKNVHLSELT